MCQVLKDHQLITPSKAELNVTRLNQVMKIDCDFIIHLACETDHEYCDENPSQCYFVNTIGTANLMRLANELYVPIVYLSSASIFDGDKRSPYNGEDIPNPINHYNASKWYAELILRNCTQAYILRAGWMFGGGHKIDKKFVQKIITKILNGQRSISVASDCIGSPTYTKDLALYIKDCVDGKYHYGTHNCANSSSTKGVSRYMFAKEIVKILGSKVKIKPVSIDTLTEEFPCKRTNYEVLENNNLRDWKVALEEYLNHDYRY